MCLHMSTHMYMMAHIWPGACREGLDTWGDFCEDGGSSHLGSFVLSHLCARATSHTRLCAADQDSSSCHGALSLLPTCSSIIFHLHSYWWVLLRRVERWGGVGGGGGGGGLLSLLILTRAGETGWLSSPLTLEDWSESVLEEVWLTLRAWWLRYLAVPSEMRT